MLPVAADNILCAAYFQQLSAAEACLDAFSGLFVLQLPSGLQIGAKVEEFKTTTSLQVLQFFI